MLCSRLKWTRSFSSIVSKRYVHRELKEPQFDLKYLLDPTKLEEIEKNIHDRKGVGDIKLVQELHKKFQHENTPRADKIKLNELFKTELSKIPNKSHPDAASLESPKVVEYFNAKPSFQNGPLDFSEICKKLNILRTDHLGNFTGPRSYYLMSDLAELEQALIKFTVEKILKSNFQLMTVPDILPPNIIKSCGMQVVGERTQVYRLLPSELCLSGTSEMSLAGYFSGKILDLEKLPIKCAAISRCFRAETSSLLEERGIYRVHQFTKVEMFSVCRSNQSESLLNEFRDIEVELFKEIGVHFQLLDMPPFELGAPAFRKYDIEAWMPGRSMWGEISSCSNCTDYQSRRLNILVNNNNKLEVEFAHTVNGTACAIPRMLIAIIETFQRDDGSVSVPKVLKKFMKKDKILKRKILPELKLVKNIAKN